MRLIVAIGARPNVVKAAPLLPELASAGIDVDVAFTGSRSMLHPDDSGEHKPTFYGVAMDAPTWFLDVGTDTDAVQTGRAMVAFEELFSRHRADAVMVIGDVNPTVAAAISAAKACVPVVHLGAGVRCGDLSLPEEINRTLISRVSAVHLVPTEEAFENLLAEGIAEERIHFVGNMMAESVIRHLDTIRHLEPAKDLGLEPKKYVLASFHRPENVTKRERICQIIAGLEGSPLPVVVVDASGLRKVLANYDCTPSASVRIIDAVPYRDMLALARDAACVVTDSGGLQEEACTMCTPCVTVRRSVEHSVTLTTGANVLAEADANEIVAAIRTAVSRPCDWSPPKRWDKAVSDRVIRAVKRGVHPLA